MTLHYRYTLNPQIHLILLYMQTYLTQSCPESNASVAIYQLAGVPV
jgi:hypothetical protein